MFLDRFTYFSKYNVVKIRLLIVLSVITNFIFSYFYFGETIISLFTSLLIFITQFVILNNIKFLLNIFRYFDIKYTVGNDGLQRKIESFLAHYSNKAPLIILTDFKLPLFFTLSTNKESILFVDKFIIEENSEDSIDYILSNESYKIIVKLSCLYTVATVYFGLPLILLDLVVSYLNKYKFFIISALITSTLGWVITLYSFCFYSLFFSKNDLISADVYSSKILGTTRGFSELIKSTSINTKSHFYMPRSLSLFLPVRDFIDSLQNRLLSFKEFSVDRIIRISSIIG